MLGLDRPFTSNRLPSTSATTRDRLLDSATSRRVATVSACSSVACVAAALDELVQRAAGDEIGVLEDRAVDAGSASATPPTSNSPSARSIRRRACSRSESHTISLATMGS